MTPDPAQRRQALKGNQNQRHPVATRTIERCRNDPAFGAEYLNAILEDGDQEGSMLALRRISEAFGGVQKLARSARLNANTLYRALSSKGNPELKRLRAVLRGDGHAAHCPSTGEKCSLSYDYG